MLLPDRMTCPLCAQDGRRRSYERQRQQWSREAAEAVQRLPKPAVPYAAE